VEMGAASFLLCQDNMREFLTLKDFFLEYKWRYVLGIIWVLIVDSLQLVTPRLLGIFTDELLSAQPDTGTLHLYIFIILAAAAGIAFFRYLWRLYIIGTSRLLEKHLREKLFDHLQGLSTRFYLKRKTGDLMAHITNDITAVRTSLGFSVVMLIDSIFVSAAAVIIMFVTADIRLTLLALIPFPLLAIAFQKLGKRVYRRFLSLQGAFADMTGVVQENITASRVVKAFALEEKMKESFEESSRKYVEENFALYKLWGLYNPLIYLFSITTFIIVLLYGGNLVMQGEISIGDFVAFNGYLALLTWPMLAFGWVINISQRGRASMERINRLLQTMPEITDHPSAPGGSGYNDDQTPGQNGSSDSRHHSSPSLSFTNPQVPGSTPEGDIVFENVTFRYEKDQLPVLDKLNLTFAYGKINGITGRTGSGKSTLFYLILRLFDPDEGTILVNNIPLKQVPLKSWRKKLGYVPQDNFIFSTTIAENIAFAYPDASLAEIKNAAKLAALDEEIEAFPEGYETMVGERGITLSGGQQQRLALARVLLLNPPFLLIDDAFSSVDVYTEEAIINNLRQISRDTTIIIITHRIKSLQLADKIMVLDDGKMSEEGSHEELLAQEGFYSEIFSQQAWERL